MHHQAGFSLARFSWFKLPVVLAPFPPHVRCSHVCGLHTVCTLDVWLRSCFPQTGRLCFASVPLCARIRMSPSRHTVSTISRSENAITWQSGKGGRDFLSAPLYVKKATNAQTARRCRNPPATKLCGSVGKVLVSGRCHLRRRCLSILWLRRPDCHGCVGCASLLTQPPP
ncbi:hypothetical protein IWX49DRAFT_106316 [Phyllosticta citricarpa]|uniref:Secreted protein n=2 Tax=Phyllosticta TaxID=121621 RepID=A0ABR1MGK5_9PEZI